MTDHKSIFLKNMIWLITFFAVISSAIAGNVTYDGRSLIIDGEHRILFSGSIHYPRSTPEMWPSLIAKAKAGGIDVIETYLFWNQHEPQQGQFDFSGRRDLVRFIKEVQAQGLYVCLRMGPFIQAEWTYGGFPFWLHDVPGIIYRSDNEPFKHHMKIFLTKIVNKLKAEKLYYFQGGPIILSQIENEYQNVEAAFHEKGPPYVRWAAKLAVELDTGTPWVMCKQNDAPDPVINACNGMRCGDTFPGPNSPNKPAIWTENWTSFYEAFGEENRVRSAEDIAFHVALFIAAKKGSFINYYMYHGGTNLGRTSAAYMRTGYYDQAPLDEYGLLRQPKWGHLKELHAAVKLCARPLLYGEHTSFPLGRFQQAYVFRQNSYECAAFLVSKDRRSAKVLFENSSYVLPPKSISILPDCKTVAFNTAKVNTHYGTRLMQMRKKFDSIQQWEEYKEVIPVFNGTPLRANTLLEHMNTTKDASDYLWYTFRLVHALSDAQSVLQVHSLGHNLHVFVNGVYIGSQHGSKDDTDFTLEKTVPLKNGINHISLLSVMTGLPDSGAYLEHRVAGLRSVRIETGDDLTDFTSYPWGYQVGLFGEKIQVYTESGSQTTRWKSYTGSNDERLTWYKTRFDAPAGNDPVALNLGSMGKGEVWVNGQSIGRYWVSFLTPDGNPSQTWYNVPRSFLKPSGNLLVILEEENGNPLGVSIDTISIAKVCGHVSESHPPPVISWRGQSPKNNFYNQKYGRRPKVQLRCQFGRKISKVLFSSFGTPVGDCGNYAIGRCHLPNSTAIVERACIGRNRCSIPVSISKLGGDPCPHVTKSLLVDAVCT